MLKLTVPSHRERTLRWQPQAYPLLTDPLATLNPGYMRPSNPVHTPTYKNIPNPASFCPCQPHPHLKAPTIPSSQRQPKVNCTIILLYNLTQQILWLHTSQHKRNGIQRGSIARLLQVAAPRPWSLMLSFMSCPMPQRRHQKLLPSNAEMTSYIPFSFVCLT